MSSDLLKYHEIRKKSAIAEAGEPELEKIAFKLTEWSGMKPASSYSIEQHAATND
jgi:hypothetical protein